jgi:hypothetical protein
MMCVDVHVHRVLIDTDIPTCACVRVYVCKYECVCKYVVCVCARAHVFVCVHVHTYLHVHINIYIHVYIHLCIYNLSH